MASLKSNIPPPPPKATVQNAKGNTKEFMEVSTKEKGRVTRKVRGYCQDNNGG